MKLGGRIYGYHRTSTKEQHPDRGIYEIEEYCRNNNIPLNKVFVDQCTGKNFDRPRYIVLKEDLLEKGDTLIVTEIDRLGRQKDEITNELRSLRERGIIVRILEIPTTLMNYSGMDNSTCELMVQTINNLLIELYAVLAQTELEKNKKRQREGFDRMKARGEWDRFGRPPAFSQNYFNENYQRVLKGESTRLDFIHNFLRVSDATFYKYKRIYESKYGNNLMPIKLDSNT